MDELLDPKVDFVFKRIFGSEENKDVLLKFLNDALGRSHDRPLESIVLVNPYIDKDALEDKQSILDIHAIANGQEQINIEIQIADKYDIEKRTLYYWAKMYEEQLQEGEQYKDLKKTITINILNFKITKGEYYHNVFHLREDTTKSLLTEDIEIHFMELPKLDQDQFPYKNDLNKWMLFLKGIDQTEWEELAMEMPELKKAMTTLEFLSQDEEARRLYKMRQKALLDERSALGKARREGMEEGKREAVEKMALNLVRKGMDTPSIAEVTGLSESEIEKLEKK